WFHGACRCNGASDADGLNRLPRTIAYHSRKSDRAAGMNRLGGNAGGPVRYRDAERSQGNVNFDLLKRLCETPGISSREERMRALVAGELQPLTDGITVDAMGNVIGEKRGS